MRYSITRGGVPIGYSNLEHRNEATGVVSGVLQTTPAYEPLRPVFQRVVWAVGDLPEEMTEDAMVASEFVQQVIAVSALGLELHDATGATVPTRSINVLDLSAIPDADEIRNGCLVSVALADGAPWQPLDRASPSRSERSH